MEDDLSKALLDENLELVGQFKAGSELEGIGWERRSNAGKYTI